MFYTFGDPTLVREIIGIWEEGKIGSDIAFTRMSQTITDFNSQKFSEFIDSMEITPGFQEFIKYCEQNRIEVKILSDGLDLYIKPFLDKHNLSHLMYYSNKLKIDSNNNFSLDFPYSDEECKLCANCKRNHLISHSSDNDYTIYIGDGHSDKCAAQYCDFIFAKNYLLKYCEMNRITYFPFNDFYQVKNKLDELKNKKRLKKKLRAELKRKELYKQG